MVKYGDVRLADELQFSVYNFEAADVDKLVEALRSVRGGVQGALEARILSREEGTSMSWCSFGQRMALADSSEREIRRVSRCWRRTIFA